MYTNPSLRGVEYSFRELLFKGFIPGNELAVRNESCSSTIHLAIMLRRISFNYVDAHTCIDYVIRLLAHTFPKHSAFNVFKVTLLISFLHRLNRQKIPRLSKHQKICFRRSKRAVRLKLAHTLIYRTSKTRFSVFTISKPIYLPDHLLTWFSLLLRISNFPLALYTPECFYSS